jgi:hypothetical protein
MTLTVLDDGIAAQVGRLELHLAPPAAIGQVAESCAWEKL